MGLKSELDKSLKISMGSCVRVHVCMCVCKAEGWQGIQAEGRLLSANI